MYENKQMNSYVHQYKRTINYLWAILHIDVVVVVVDRRRHCFCVMDAGWLEGGPGLIGGSLGPDLKQDFANTQNLLKQIFSSLIFRSFLSFSLPVRHGFVNEAYDNVESVNMTPTQRTGEYAQPTNPSQAPTQPAPSQPPVAYFAGIN